MKAVAEATNTELLVCIETAPEAQRKDAWNELMKRDKKSQLHNLCLCHIAARAEPPYQHMAWELLLERGASAIDLCCLIKQAKDPSNPYQQRAWEMVLEMAHEDGYCFYYLLEYAPEPYQGDAWEQYRERGYPIHELESSLHYKNQTLFWKERIAPFYVKKPR